ncbi:hypothetical protein K2224_38195 (plasmid) [Streptomyces sp. BHT-5-2]|uniref:SAM-dependent methyltransferase n=1 Tax=unclassified Streptomyces TaxID=2593676 RepID=UPI001C8D64D2|nr:SAM-dependent methyltransferase [Streptomyces sp. BHT-5-2]QZL08854.1 hypothetical protein K2224_38195 [Streptomyces sp. BHT-5-2]
MTATNGRAELIVVGTGYRAVGDLTLEAKACLEQADTVLCLAGDPMVIGYLERLNPTVRTLAGCYAKGKHRSESYEEMVQEILSEVRRERLVCCAFYGHPGVFAYPGHEAVRRARLEGIPARMLAGSSAEDWLFADLGLDPGTCGCQSFEASDFLLHRRLFDPTSLLVLWQVGVIGMTDRNPDFDARVGAALLAERLAEAYGVDHEVTVYEASPYPVTSPRISPVPLAKLADTQLTNKSTLVVPPLPSRPPDREVVARLYTPE